MNLTSTANIKAKPFLKWAGGKTQLLSTIDSFLPAGFAMEPNVTYIEPFVGGGALLFHMLQKYPNIKHAVINDINKHLVTAYTVIRDNADALIDTLAELQASFREIKDYERQKEFYLDIRSRFNQSGLTDIDEAAYMIFLNRTCFNGLYRENAKGGFNVPFGRYVNPTICDAALIKADSELLQRVEITHGDFARTRDYASGYTLFYFDPPYRPLDSTSSFNSYVKETFNDNEQIRLKEFFAQLSADGHRAMLSNSDCKGRNDDDDFFDELYSDFYIERVYARRSINANGAKRGTLTELLIRNYRDYQSASTNLFNL